MDITSVLMNKIQVMDENILYMDKKCKGIVENALHLATDYFKGCFGWGPRERVQQMEQSY